MSTKKSNQRKSNEPAEEDVPMDVEEGPDEEEGGIRIGDIYLPPPPPAACTFDPTGPRLMITHIENFNFKSYQGRQVIGPFHKNFTAIVGPNGSGKSNVIDSMLFVFGYRAQKIRSKKTSVLIHNSENHTNVQSCTVNVHFQKIIDKSGDEFEVVPDTKFVIGRSAHKDNTSYYTVNGKRCQFREASRMLRSFGIDLDHNRFLILQGEVEQIALMKPKAVTEHDQGMLEFLEDIIGSSRYKEPIELLNKRVEELQEERTEKLGRVKMVEKEMEELEGPRNEALEYLRIENEIVMKKHYKYRCYQKEEEGNLETASKELEQMKDKAKEMMSKVEEQKKVRKERVNERNAIGKKYEDMAKEVDKKKADYNKLEQQDLHFREAIKHSKAKSKKLEKALEMEEKKLEELSKMPEKFEKEIKEMTKKKEEMEEEKKVHEKKLQEVMASLKTDTLHLQEKKEEFEKKLLEMQKEVSEAKSKFDLAQSELNLFVVTEKKEKNRLQEIKTNLEVTAKTLKEKTELLQKLEKIVPETDGKLQAVNVELLQVTEEEQKLRLEMRTDRQKVEEARSSMQASRSKNRVLDSIMQQKHSGNIPGVFGRLGDLGAIDQKYDVAISTACGQLDNILTDSVLTAQRCVEFLKNNNIGKATFIALDKQDKFIEKAKEKIATPENVPRLFDLIKVKEERFLSAFYFVLRDTLVAENIDQATRIGLQGRTRHRVVTLKGEVIEPAGTMSGGGGRVISGKMGKSIMEDSMPAEQVDSMARSLEVKETRTAELLDKKGILEDKILSLQKQIKTEKHSLQKFQVETKALSDKHTSLSSQLKQQEERVKQVAPDQNRVKELEKNVEVAKKAYDKVASSSNEIEKKVQKLHSEIMEITEDRVGSVQSKLDSLNNQLDGTSSKITQASAGVRAADRNRKKCEDKIISLKDETVENENTYKNAKEELKKIEEEAKGIMEDLEKCDKEKDELCGKLAEINKIIEENTKEENKLNSQSIEIRNELDQCDGKLKACQGKVHHWKEKLKKLVLQVIDGEPQQTLPDYTEDQLAEVDHQHLDREIAVLESKIEKTKPNLGAITEYRKKEASYKEKVAELDAVTSSRDEQRKYLEDLRKQRLNEFMTGFQIITTKLKEMYQMITLGGDAELELVDSLDPFSEGILFSVRPPKKSWKNISNLSGGEKTLSSLALVFALHYYKPTPFYVMDEIDAALDFKNVSIVGNYIKERTRNAQFIIISLRNNMFELADRLVGIYKTYNCTKSVAINPRLISGIQNGAGDLDIKSP